MSMDTHYYLAEGFEHYLKILVDDTHDLYNERESSESLLSCRSTLLSRLAIEAIVIQPEKVKGDTLWIEEHKANLVVEEHNSLFPTPFNSIEQLMASNIFRSLDWHGKSGFEIHLVGRVGSVALAFMWEIILERGSSEIDSSQKFSNWFEKAKTNLNAAFNSPKYMTAESKRQYLDECVPTILAKKTSLNDRELRNPPPENGSDPIRYLQWAESIEAQRERQITDIDEGVATLIGQVTKFDSLTGNYKHRCHRIRRLLTSDSPFIVQWTAECIHLNPRALAWVLTDPRTVSIGLALIETIRIPEMSGWQSLVAGERDANSESERTEFWKRAVRIVAGVLGVNQTDWTEVDRAKVVYEVVQYLVARETDARRQFYFNPALGKVKETNVVHRKKIWLEQIASSNIHTRIIDGKRTYFPTILSQIAWSLWEICQIRRNPKRDNFEAMPRSEIELLTWMLVEIQNDRLNLSRLDEFNIGVARSVVQLYTDELKRSKYGTNDKYTVSWTHESDIWQGIRWDVLARILFENHQLDLLITPHDFEGQIRRLPQTNDRELHEIHSDQDHIARKLRTHLKIMLDIYSAARSSLGEFDIKGSEREFLTQIEKGISSLLVKNCELRPELGQLDIFDQRYESDLFGGRPSLELAPQVANELNHFDQAKRSGILDSLCSTKDLHRLIVLAAGLTGEGSKADVLKRMNKVLSENPFDGEYWLPRLEQMAIYSANAALSPVAKELISHLDKITEGHPYLEKWREIKFKIQLVMAYHDRDKTTIETLPIPDINETKAYGEPSFNERMENRRAHLLALLNLESDPEDSIKTLERLKSELGEPLEYSLNLFRARIESAKKMSPKDSYNALKEAYKKWEVDKRAAEDTIKRGQMSSLFETIYFCELECLTLLSDQSGVGELVKIIPDRHLLSIPFLKLLVPFYMNVGLYDELSNIKRRAHDFHRSFSGAETPEWDEIEKLIQEPISISETPQAPIAVQPSVDKWEMMRQWYPLLKGATPERLASIVRGEECSPGRFILHELLFTIHTILDQKVLFSRFPDLAEPEQTLLMTILLKTKLHEWGWGAEPESPGGETKTDSPGRRDIAINAPGGNGKIALIEALKLGSVEKASIKDHLERLFMYDTTGDEAGFLVSFVEVVKQDKFWSNYKTFIDSVVIPSASLEQNLQELEGGDFPASTRIRIGVSKHLYKGIPRVVYHLIVNLT